MSKPTVCVDLDGTLAHYGTWKGPGHIGEPRPGAREFMKALSQRARVLIFTCRTKCDDPVFMPREPGVGPEDMADTVRAWLDRHGIPYDDVYTGQGKPVAAAYLDDRAVAIPPPTPTPATTPRRSPPSSA